MSGREIKMRKDGTTEDIRDIGNFGYTKVVLRYDVHEDNVNELEFSNIGRISVAYSKDGFLDQQSFINVIDEEDVGNEEFERYLTRSLDVLKEYILKQRGGDDG